MCSGGARGRPGGYSPPSKMLVPHQKVKSKFFRDFFHLKYPVNRILAPLSEKSAPLLKLPGATPACVIHLLKEAFFSLLKTYFKLYFINPDMKLWDFTACQVYSLFLICMFPYCCLIVK